MGCFRLNSVQTSPSVPPPPFPSPCSCRVPLLGDTAVPRTGFSHSHNTTLVLPSSRDAVLRQIQERTKAVKSSLGMFSGEKYLELEDEPGGGAALHVYVRSWPAAAAERLSGSK